MNHKFAEHIFPVVLSTQWTSIYDKEIQELLGFYSLCSYVFDKSSSRSVYLRVCPIQFALYLRLRAAMDILNKETDNCQLFNPEAIVTCVDNVIGHTKYCNGESRFRNGLIFLSTVHVVFNISSSRPLHRGICAAQLAVYLALTNSLISCANQSNGICSDITSIADCISAIEKGNIPDIFTSADNWRMCVKYSEWHSNKESKSLDRPTTARSSSDRSVPRTLASL